MKKQISQYISLSEATKSQTATRLNIANVPDARALAAMQKVAREVFDPVREFVGGILYVSSFYRSPVLNKAIGGSPSSQHCKGEAIDIDADVYNTGGVNNRQIFEYIRTHLEFDQLIWEFGTDQNPAWVHASKRAAGNRRQVLRAKRNEKNQAYYEPLTT